MVVNEWRDLLGDFAPVVWVSIVILGAAWLFLPFWVYVDAKNRGAGRRIWTGMMAIPPLLLIPIGLFFLRFLPLWTLGVLILPVAVFVIYLIQRTTTPTCPDCGQVMRPEWRHCPRHPRRMADRSEAGFGPLPSASGFGPAMPFPSPEIGGAWGGREPASAGGPSAAQGAIGFLVVHEGRQPGKQYYVPPEGLVLGRDETSDIPLEDGTASARHARLAVSDGRAQIIDLGSRNGTFVNDAPVDRSFVYDGDRIRVGDTTLVFKELS